MIDTEIEFYIRTRYSIDDMLYEVDSFFVKPEAGKQFNSIDIIFIEGDANLRPWSESATKVKGDQFKLKLAYDIFKDVLAK